MSVCLTSKGTNSFCSRLSFQGYLLGKQFWKEDIVSPTRAEDTVVYHPA
jgi:hypothetical protein